MRYCGSKARFAKDIIPIITKHLNGENYFVEPFMGGANILCSVDYKRKIGADKNKYVSALWRMIRDSVVNGECISLPIKMTKDEYNDIKKSYINKDKRYPDWLIGYTGTALSFGGAWFNGFTGYNPNKNEDHVIEAYNGIIKQIRDFKYLDSTIFYNMSYDELYLPEESVIYCDPPYRSTKKYDSDFDNDAFWEWARKKSMEGHYVYVSEYEAPDDFICIWKKDKKDSMGSSRRGTTMVMCEKLFVTDF